MENGHEGCCKGDLDSRLGFFRVVDPGFPRLLRFLFYISFSWYIFITDGKIRLFLRVCFGVCGRRAGKMLSIETAPCSFYARLSVCLTGCLASLILQCYMT